MKQNMVLKLMLVGSFWGFVNLPRNFSEELSQELHRKNLEYALGLDPDINPWAEDQAEKKSYEESQELLQSENEQNLNENEIVHE